MRLHYPRETELNIKRIKRGDSFSFVNKSGKKVSQKDKERIAKMAIPPAWKNVTTSSDPISHIQAIGEDSRGRKQYIYHPLFIKQNQKQKFDQLVDFGKALPDLRKAINAHMKEHTLTRNRILATVVWLLEHTFIRVGNKVYENENQSYGLTTMRHKHISLRGCTVTFSFKGKSGVFHELDITHPRVAKTIKACIDLPGYELFQYVDENNNKSVVDSSDVNEYLQIYAGSDFSAKDFRTWGGSVLAGDSLYKKGNALSPEDLKDNISKTVAEVSKHLGNTKRVCHTYYIHPVILSSYEKNILVPHFERSYSRMLSKKLALTHEEYATWSLLKDS